MNHWIQVILVLISFGLGVKLGRWHRNRGSRNTKLRRWLDTPIALDSAIKYDPKTGTISVTETGTYQFTGPHTRVEFSHENKPLK